MALPTIISTSSYTVMCGRGGPYVSSAGNVYVILAGWLTAGPSSNFAALKATDPTTSFSVAGGVQTVTSLNTVTRIATQQVGDIVHVVTLDVSGSSVAAVRYHKFDMSTDTWTTVNEAVKTGFTIGNTQSGLGLHTRSNGDIVVYYQGVNATVMGSGYTRTDAARKVGSTWTIDIAIDANTGTVSYAPSSLVAGASDRSHFFYFDTTGAQYERTMTSANVLESGPPASYGSGGTTTTYEVQAPGSYVSSGGTTKVRNPTLGTSFAGVNVAGFDSADAPTVSIQTDIDGSGITSVYNNEFVSFLADDGTTLWHGFLTSGTLNIIKTQSSVDGAAWSTPSTAYTAPSDAITRLWGRVITRGGVKKLAVCYSYANSPPGYAVYNEFSVGSAPVTHATTGGIVASDTVKLAGAASIKKSHATSGAAGGQGAATVGSARRFRAHATSGALSTNSARVDGASNRYRTHASSGVLAAGTAKVVSSSGRYRTHASAGVLAAGQGATTGSSRRYRTHATIGAVSSGVGSVAAASQRFRTHTSTGALATAPAKVAGAVAKTRTHISSGVLAAQGSAVIANATRMRAHSASGVLGGGWAAVTGSASHFVSFTSYRQQIIDGLVSAQSEPSGWNAKRSQIPVTAVVRTSDTVVTITLPGLAGYDITAAETITSTVPGGAVTSGLTRVAKPTFTVAPTAAPSHLSAGTVLGGQAQTAGSANRLRAHAAAGGISGGKAMTAGAARRDHSHGAVGVLQTGAAKITGSATRYRAHAANGALASGAGATAGAARRFRLHVVSGGLLAGAGSVSGGLTHFSGKTGVGALVGQRSSVTGSAYRTHTHMTTGALAAGVAKVAGTARRDHTHTTAGVLLTQQAKVAGSASRTRIHTTSGALSSKGSVAGAVGRFSGKNGTGSLRGQGAQTAGVAGRMRSHAASGSITAGVGRVSGSSLSFTIHVVSGVISGRTSLAGAAARTRVHTVAGALATSGSVAGNVLRFRTHATGGVVVAGYGAVFSVSDRPGQRIGTMSAVESGLDTFSTRRAQHTQMFAFFH